MIGCELGDCSPEYVRFELEAQDKAAPADTRTHWPSMKSFGWNNPDTILPMPLRYGEGMAYWFKDGKYAKIYLTVDTTDRVLEGPLNINQGWNTLKQAGFYSVRFHISALLALPSDQKHGPATS